MEDENPESDIPEMDSIDEAFIKLIHDSPLGDDLADEDFDLATDVLYSIIGDFVDSNEMEEIPDNEEPEEKKQQWLSTYLEKIKEEFLASVFLENTKGTDADP